MAPSAAQHQVCRVVDHDEELGNPFWGLWDLRKMNEGDRQALSDTCRIQKITHSVTVQAYDFTSAQLTTDIQPKQHMLVESMEKRLESAEPMGTREKWKRHCIFRVPPRLKVGRGDVFTPQTVALGPFHHHHDALRPMEAHKLRAVRRLLRRAGDRPWRELAAAVGDIAEELEDAYAGLDGEWLGDENRDRFLEMMITDGCFLLEVMRGKFEDYDPHDPVFGEHAMKHIEAFVLLDMLMIENQLPLSLLRRIVEFETGKLPWPSSSVWTVGALPGSVRDSGFTLSTSTAGVFSGVRRSTTHRHNKQLSIKRGTVAFRQQVVIIVFQQEEILQEQHRRPAYVAIPRRTRRIRPPRTTRRRARRRGSGKPESGSEAARHADSTTSISTSAHGGWRCTRSPWTTPPSTGSATLAFEALHFDGTDNRNGVTAFVLFMRDMIDSKDDVAVLCEGKVLENELAGSDKAVVALFNRLTMDVSKFGDSKLCQVRKKIEHYCDNHKCRVFIFRSWAKLRNSHLSSPWAFMALVFSLLLIGTDITQTLYTVMAYWHEINKDRAQAPQAAKWIGH
ncbi:hypothetical protein HU200_063748 [Digitaria exilis]|uniref:Uncharacterized protein n=1 Tax=Digitaria exilis TaxID=1010633 RepID=A0A835AAT8_9POAL|nr:hypothetical protein HU200_063748 [Digitaria exilis]